MDIYTQTVENAAVSKAKEESRKSYIVFYIQQVDEFEEKTLLKGSQQKVYFIRTRCCC